VHGRQTNDVVFVDVSAFGMTYEVRRKLRTRAAQIPAFEQFGRYLMPAILG
jgi:hypothetical protein